MPPIPPPSSGIKSKTFTVDNTIPDNTVIIDPFEFLYVNYILESDPTLYDGQIKVEQLRQDGGWAAVDTLSIPNDSIMDFLGASSTSQPGSSNANVFPAQIRVRVVTACTQGTVSIKVNYI